TAAEVGTEDGVVFMPTTIAPVCRPLPPAGEGSCSLERGRILPPETARLPLMLGRWTKGLLHLLVGGACAALVAWLAFGFSTTVIHTHGPVRWLMAALVGLSILVALALLLAPPVRAAEVALATAL